MAIPDGLLMKYITVKPKKEKLKIAMLGHKRIPSREGGVEVVVTELSTRMAALGHSVTCYNRSGHHVAGQEYDTSVGKSYKGVKLVNVPTINIRGLAAVTSSYFGAILAAFGKFDVVHFHAEGPCVSIWIPKLFRKKCIVTIHGLDHQRQKWGELASRYIILGEKRAVKYADEIIVLSSNAQKYFKEKYNRETILIPNGVIDPEPVPADLICKKYGLQKDEYLLYLGRLVPEKGLEYLIKAFKEIDTSKKLIVAGGSSDMHEFESSMRELSEGDPRIVFTGFVQGRVLEELLSNCYSFVIPSDVEGMPLTLLEAMSYGNCCITSDIPECTEVVDDNAIIFRRGDVNDLKDKLTEVCADTTMVERYRALSKKHISRKYQWDKVVEETINLYRRDQKHEV